MGGSSLSLPAAIVAVAPGPRVGAPSCVCLPWEASSISSAKHASLLLFFSFPLLQEIPREGEEIASDLHRCLLQRHGLLKSGLVLLLGSLLGRLVYRRALRPPPPNICGTPGGPPVTATRVKLRDGRHLAYLESGVPRATANHKIVFVHGINSSRHDVLPVSQVTSFPEVLEELGVCLISYDRPGYGESDPDPSKTERSNALDIQDLADQLDLGDRFYVIGFSVGGQLVWSCLKHIPHRLAGAALVAPIANFWWRGFPADVSRKAYAAQLPQDKWAASVAHHAPWLTYWWNTQEWFPPSSLIARSRRIYSPPDLKLISELAGPRRPHRAQVKQQGVFETLHRDMMLAFGKWDYSPLELRNPAPGKEGAVHLWHDADDLVVTPIMSRHIAQELPWIRYHELPDAGHLLTLADGVADIIVKSLLLGE
ncbi:uncharacterized protein LOC133886531 [Phragmites australis]|uniref:uncharacterized protein LOC133886531 n=1 Tax=Phragmites australis TaxID=29695 RepID=UPI002D777D64|nr:uncharacterized protein LOC133886531 [Phragmites australis]